jgi:hypothetical protein
MTLERQQKVSTREWCGSQPSRCAQLQTKSGTEKTFQLLTISVTLFLTSATGKRWVIGEQILF